MCPSSFPFSSPTLVRFEIGQDREVAVDQQFGCWRRDDSSFAPPSFRRNAIALFSPIVAEHSHLVHGRPASVDCSATRSASLCRHSNPFNRTPTHPSPPTTKSRLEPRRLLQRDGAGAPRAHWSISQDARYTLLARSSQILAWAHGAAASSEQRAAKDPCAVVRSSSPSFFEGGFACAERSTRLGYVLD